MKFKERHRSVCFLNSARYCIRKEKKTGSSSRRSEECWAMNMKIRRRRRRIMKMRMKKKEVTRAKRKSNKK